MKFSIEKKLPGTLARAGTLETKNGTIQTPAFVVVGTKATVKALTAEQIRSLGAQVVLANTYHLYLQPGTDIVEKAGGFGSFMDWHGPTMTDSGGFQAFSLGAAFGSAVSKVAAADTPVEDISPTAGQLANVTDEGVTFKSHIDGSMHLFTPESSMEAQWSLGADMIFAFDECTSPTAPYEYQKKSLARTENWAQRSLKRHNELDTENKQALFGVVQGGSYEELRRESARTLGAMDFDGYGIGGSFTKEDMGTAVRWVCEELPENKPRHLLGIGEPVDILLGIENGIDTFDCVSPTRQGRNGALYTYDGRINITNAKFKEDMSPVSEKEDWYTHQFTKSYLHHLFKADEMLAGTLASVHNLKFLVTLCEEAREALTQGTFQEFKESFIERYYR